MDGIDRVLIIYRNLWSLVVSLTHFTTFTMFSFFICTQHLNTMLLMLMDLAFVLKWVKSVIG